MAGISRHHAFRRLPKLAVKTELAVDPEHSRVICCSLVLFEFNENT